MLKTEVRPSRHRSKVWHRGWSQKVEAEVSVTRPRSRGQAGLEAIPSLAVTMGIPHCDGLKNKKFISILQPKAGLVQ